jgi:E3 ubiquitin-protein ligase UBR1
LLTHWNDKKCNKCKSVPKIPALCLFCGDLICLHSPCCTEVVDDFNSLSETVQVSKGKRLFFKSLKHMRKCSGQGVFFLFKECVVLLARKVDGAYVNGGFFNSVYLDKYGEEDVGFKRGKPLFLEPGRYEELRKMWLQHGLDDNVVKRGPKHYSL